MHVDILENFQPRRTGRSVRKAPTAKVRIGERDRWILDALARMQFLVTRQIAHLLFNGSRSAANKRLRKLYDAGLIRLWLRALNADNVYALAPLGRRILEDDLDRTTRCPRELDGRIDHLLAINAVRIALATSLAETNGEIAWWRSDWELRAKSRQRTIPDALFALNWMGAGEQVFALEVEYGTRAPRSFQGKLLRYGTASYRRGGIYGETSPIVLVVGHHPAWLARYRAATVPLPLSIAIGFATLDEVQRQGAAGAVWKDPRSDRGYSLRELTTLPYRKEGLASDLVGESSVCAAYAAHNSPL